MFRFKSIRSKLIAITMLIFAMVLVVITAVTHLAYRHAVMNSIDDYLRKDSANFAVFSLRRHPGRFGHRRDDHPKPGSPKDDHPHDPPRTRDVNWTNPTVLPVQDVPTGLNVQALAYDLKGYLEARKGKTVLRTIFAAGEPRRVISTPAIEQGRVRNVVQVPYGLGRTLDGLSRSEGMLIRMIIPLGILMAGAASFVVVSRLLIPLRRMTEEADRIGESGFGERLKPLGTDEFAALAGTLNGMLNRLEFLYQAEKETSGRLARAVEQQRRFTSDASHELKTPLTVIRAHLGVLRQSKRAVRDEMESLQDMEDASKRMSGLLQDLLVLARTDAGIHKARSECSINAIVLKAIGSVVGAGDRSVLLASDEFIVSVTPDELHRVFVNLIENALKHSESKAPISIRIYGSESTVTVVVEDFGIGIKGKDLPHIFERFYRADESRTSDSGGSGLGLAICEQLIQANGGSVRVESEEGKGTKFLVSLPMIENTFIPSSSPRDTLKMI